MKKRSHDNELENIKVFFYMRELSMTGFVRKSIKISQTINGNADGASAILHLDPVDLNTLLKGKEQTSTNLLFAVDMYFQERKDDVSEEMKESIVKSMNFSNLGFNVLSEVMV